MTSTQLRPASDLIAQYNFHNLKPADIASTSPVEAVSVNLGQGYLPIPINSLSE